MKIGFIGTGIMGGPMAGNLQKAGHDLFLLKHRSPLPQDLIDGGAISCSSAKAVAEAADIVITMVPNTPEVEAVLFGQEGIAEGLQPGGIIIDMSSIDPLATKDFAARIREKGGHYVDAPVSGGDVGAKEGTLTIMVGAEDEIFAKVLPLFEVMGRTVTHVGENGAGQTTKLCNQIVVALNIEAVAEALILAEKAGVNPAKVREALLGGFASSRVLERHGQKMLDADFTPGFTINLHQKDLDNVLATAKSLGVALPNTVSAYQLLNACRAEGDAALDSAAMVKPLAALAGAKMGRH